MSDAGSTSTCGSSTSSPVEPSTLRHPRPTGIDKQSISKKRRVSGKSDSEHDAPFYTKTPGIPNRVSAWKIETAEGLGIYYNKEFHKHPSDVLAIIQKNSTCSELKDTTPDLAELASRLKKVLDFDDIDISEHDKVKGFLDRSYRITIGQSLSKVKHEIFKRLEESKFGGSGREASMLNCAVEFIEQIANLLSREMMQLSGLGPVSEAIYRNLIALFARMCFLYPRTGDEFKCKRTINGVEVTSIPDIRLGKYLEDSLLLDQCPCAALVSVVEIKHPQKLDISNREVRQTRSREAKGEENEICPALLDVLGSKGRAILGQHAGELLMDYDHSVIPYMPGMIVTGTKVFFTLLEINADHIYKLYHNRKLNESKDRATIYYAEPLDVLIKSERDLLIDSFMRLNNIKRQMNVAK